MNSRYIPQNAHEYTREGVNAIIYLFTNRTNQPAAIAYAGKSNKADFHYHFKTEDQRQQYCNAWMERIAQRQATRDAHKAIRKEQASQPHHIKAGEIFYTSWGYEQTNVDFYQVISVTAHSVKLLELCQQDKEYPGMMSGYTMPCRNQFKNEKVITCRVTGENFRINGRYYAHKWDGQPKHYSTYG